MATKRVATLGTHWVPTHTNTRKYHHTQTAPRRTTWSLRSYLHFILSLAGLAFQDVPSLCFHLSSCRGADDVPRNCRRAPQRHATWALAMSMSTASRFKFFLPGSDGLPRFFITMATPATTARRRSPPTAPPTAAIITVVLSDVSEELSDLSEELVETELVVSLLVVAASGGASYASSALDLNQPPYSLLTKPQAPTF